MGRKTFNVEELVDMVNFTLLNSDDSAKGIRQGMMNVLEEVLHRSGNYRGFRYINQNELRKDQQYPGIWLKEDGTACANTAFEHTDSTRVQYR